jgi:hypothetical protein
MDKKQSYYWTTWDTSEIDNCPYWYDLISRESRLYVSIICNN